MIVRGAAVLVVISQRLKPSPFGSLFGSGVPPSAVPGGTAWGVGRVSALVQRGAPAPLTLVFDQDSKRWAVLHMRPGRPPALEACATDGDGCPAPLNSLLLRSRVASSPLRVACIGTRKLAPVGRTAAEAIVKFLRRGPA